MTFFKFTTDKTVRQLRWVVLVVMLMDAACTLIGQPAGYWSDSAKVDEIEPVVRFFLMRGVVTFAVAGSLYILVTLFLASVLPRGISLTLLFVLLLAHFRGASTWLVYNFGYNLRAESLFEIVVAVMVAWVICQAKPAAAAVVPPPV